MRQGISQPQGPAHDRVGFHREVALVATNIGRPRRGPPPTAGKAAECVPAEIGTADESADSFNTPSLAARAKFAALQEPLTSSACAKRWQRQHPCRPAAAHWGRAILSLLQKTFCMRFGG